MGLPTEVGHAAALRKTLDAGHGGVIDRLDSCRSGADSGSRRFSCRADPANEVRWAGAAAVSRARWRAGRVFGRR